MKVEWRTCFRIGVSAFLFYLCIQYWPTVAGLVSLGIGAATPLLIGCVIAYLVNILMRFYEKHFFAKSQNKTVLKCRRPVCMIAAFVSLIAVILLVVKLVVPELVECVKVIFSAVPSAINSIIKWLEEGNMLTDEIAANLSGIDWQSKVNELIGVVTSGVGNAMGMLISTLSSVFSGIVTALMALIFSIYLLLGKDTLARQCDRVMKHYLKTSWYENVKHVLDVLHDSFSRYIVGQCIEAVILGVLCAVGMALLKLPYATMIGALIAFTALIPVAGAYIGGGVGALMIFSVSPMQAVIFLAFLVVLQQLEGNLIYPKVVGSSLGLPAIWVLAAVTVGGGIMGVLGMLLGVPVASALYRLLKEDLNRPKREKCV